MPYSTLYTERFLILFKIQTHTRQFYGPFSGTTRVSRC